MTKNPAGRVAGDPRTAAAPPVEGDAVPLLTLANGVRFAALPMPHLHTASVGVYVRTGSALEPRPLNGISHFVEHMVFKGTASRDVHRINLDAERLGAEVNAHTDKDHTAYYMRGRGEHAARFVHLLADIVANAIFPGDELARERDVLLQEALEVADDPIDTAYQLFDHACWGLHAAGQAVIGSRANIQRLQRDDLVRWVQHHYVGANIVVVAAGAVDAARLADEVDAAFGGIARGRAHAPAPPDYAGGIRSRRLDGGSQAHLVLGFPIAARGDADVAGEVAAAVFGEGMSSPLLAELRERRGLVYHAACSADRFDLCGQFAVEASMAPGKTDEVLAELMRLLRRQSQGIAEVDIERARNQIAVRLLRQGERPARRMEEAALDLFALGRVRSAAEQLARVETISVDEVGDVFRRMLAAGPSLALTGSLGRGAAERARHCLDAAG